MTGGLALDPVLLTGPAPERAPARGQGAVQRLVVHPAEHQHLAAVVLLHDRRDEALAVALEAGGDGRVEGALHALDYRRAGNAVRRRDAERAVPRAARA